MGFLLFIAASERKTSDFRFSCEMLCFDIETTGLDPNRCKVTVVCTEDFVSGETKCYEFARKPDEFEALRGQLIKHFDDSISLCAFNGIRFDIPFLAKALQIDKFKIANWVAKTSDILEQSRLRMKKTFSLNLLCEKNSIPVKISDGKEAVRMAQEGRWDELNLYCAQDVKILCDLYRKQNLVHPRTEQIFDLAQWTRRNLYGEEATFLHWARQELGWLPARCITVKKVFQSVVEKSKMEKVQFLQDFVFDIDTETFVMTHNIISSAFEQFICNQDDKMQEDDEEEDAIVVE